jgi:GNAT superfamily N-acetyltransferase
MVQSRPRVGFLHADRASEVVDVLCETFFDYPVMRFVLGTPADYGARLNELITFDVATRIACDEWLLGIEGPSGLSAAATVSRPGAESPPKVANLRENMWASLGGEARSRYELFTRAIAPFEVEQPHLHLSLIGVRKDVRGHGLGRGLLEAVHALSEMDHSSVGVTLTTEVKRNVSLYERFGYEIVGQARVESSFTTWGFYRPDGLRVPGTA